MTEYQIEKLEIIKSIYEIGNEYVGVLETLENGEAFSYPVNVVSDGRLTNIRITKGLTETTTRKL